MTQEPEGGTAMTNQTLDVEADTLEAARKEASGRVRSGLSILSEKILCDGKPESLKGVGSTPEEALDTVRKKLPSGARSLSEKQLLVASKEDIEVEAHNDGEAKNILKQRIDSTATIEGICMKTPGKRGFLGIGRKPGKYQGHVSQPAVAEVTFQRKARIRIELGKWEPPATAFCQVCGKAASPQKRSGRHVRFFCSQACAMGFQEVRSGKKTLSQGTFIISMEGSLVGHCWACGKTVGVSDKTCSSCGKIQDVAL